MDDLATLYEEMAASNHKSYCEKYPAFPVDISFGTAPIFERIIKAYLKYFVEAVDGVIKDGYYWDVILKMTRTDISQERFQEIKLFIYK